MDPWLGDVTSGTAIDVAKICFVARLTNRDRCLHCPSLRALDVGQPVSSVRECEADWSAICDATSKEDASRGSRVRRTRIVGKEGHAVSSRKAPSVFVGSGAQALLRI